MDRPIYALMGGIFGAVVAALCWWLYGLAFSIRYSGPGVDPNLVHWATVLGGFFAILGFIMKDKVGDVVGDAVAAIFGFEADRSPDRPTPWHVFFLLALAAVLIWRMSR